MELNFDEKLAIVTCIEDRMTQLELFIRDESNALLPKEHPLLERYYFLEKLRNKILN